MPVNNHRNSLFILTSLFFCWGFITCLNDILIPHLKAVFELSYAQAMLVQFCFFAAYFLVSVPSGWLIERIGYQSGIVLGLIIAGLGCLLFFPAARAHQFVVFLVAFFILASGITLLQVAANPYVTVLGDPQSASSRLTLTQAFNSLGTAIAPYLGAMWILAAPVKSVAELQALTDTERLAYHAAEAASVQIPYLYLAGILFVLALVFFKLKLPLVAELSLAEYQDQTTSRSQQALSAWCFPNLRWGVLAIFVYVGAEVAIGSFMVSFLTHTEIGGLSTADAGQLVSLYWGGAMLGRFMGAWIMRYYSAGWVLAIHALLAVLLVVIASQFTGDLAKWSLLSVGICNSIMFPTIFAMALQGLGEHSGQGSGLLCSAIVGGALIPVLQGVIADHWDLQSALIVPAICYAYIMGYGFWFRRGQFAT